MKSFPDGLIAVVKRDCQTCSMIQPVMTKLAGGQTPFTVFTQDASEFLTDDEIRDPVDNAWESILKLIYKVPPS